MGLNLNFNFNIDKVNLSKLYKEAKAATISKMSAIQSDISIDSQIGDLKNNSGLQDNGIETLDLSSNVETANNNNENFNKDLGTKEMNAHNKPGNQSTTFSNVDTNNSNMNGSNSGTLKNSDAPSAIDTNNQNVTGANSGTLKNSDAPSAIDTNNPNMNGANSGTSGNNSVKPNIQSSNGDNASLSQSSPSANLNSNNSGLNQGMNSGSGNSSYNNNPSFSNGGVQNGFSGNNSDSGQLNSRDSQGNNMKPYMGQADFSTPQSFIPKVEETKSDFEQINIESPKYNDFLAEFQQKSQKKRDELASLIEEANKQIAELQNQYNALYDSEKYVKGKLTPNEYANQIDKLSLQIKNLRRKQNEWQKEIDEINEYDRVLANIATSNWEYENNIDEIGAHYKAKQSEFEEAKKLQEEYIRAYVYTYRKWALSLESDALNTANFPISATYTDENGNIQTIEFFDDTGDILENINLYVEAGMDNGYHIVLDKNGNYILKNGADVVKTTDLKVTTFEDMYNPEDYSTYFEEFKKSKGAEAMMPSPRDSWSSVHKNGDTLTLEDINNNLGIMDAKYALDQSGFEYTVDANAFEDASGKIKDPANYFRGYLLNQEKIKEYYNNFENYNDLWTYKPSLTGDEVYDYFMKNGISEEVQKFYVHLLDTKGKEVAYRYLSDVKTKILREQEEKAQFDYALDNSLKEVYYDGISKKEDYEEVLSKISDKQKVMCDMSLEEYKDYLTEEEYNTYLYLMYADINAKEEFFQKYHYVTQKEDFNEIVEEAKKDSEKNEFIENIFNSIFTEEQKSILAYLNVKDQKALSELENSPSKTYLEWKKAQLNSRIGQKEAFDAIKDYLLLEEVTPEQLTSGSLYFVDTDENGNTIYYEAIGIKPGTDKTQMCIDLGLEGFGDGVVNFSEGISNSIDALFNNLSDNPSVSQYKQMYIIEILSKTDEEVAQAFYEVGTSIGNMAIPMAASLVSNIVVPGTGEVVSSVLMGVSSGGNAALQAHMEGANYYQSLLMGVLSGGSEALIGHALGAIPGISNLEKFENLGGIKAMLAKMASEGLEESVQSILEPIMHYIIFGEDGIIDIDWGEVAKSGFYGMITAGILNGGEVIINGTITSINEYIATLSIEEQQRALDYYNSLTGDTLSLETAKYKAENTEPSIKERLSDEVNNAINKVRELAEPAEGNHNLENEISAANSKTIEDNFFEKAGDLDDIADKSVTIDVREKITDVQEKIKALTEFQEEMLKGEQSDQQTLDFIYKTFNDAIDKGKLEALDVLKTFTKLKKINPDLKVILGDDSASHWNRLNHSIVLNGFIVSMDSTGTLLHELGHCLFDCILRGKLPHNWYEIRAKALMISTNGKTMSNVCDMLQKISIIAHKKAEQNFAQNLKDNSGLTVDEYKNKLTIKYSQLLNSSYLNDLILELKNLGFSDKEVTKIYDNICVKNYSASELAQIQINKIISNMYRRLCKTEYNDYVALSDIIDAVYKGTKVDSRELTFGHGSKYYSSRPSNIAFHEIIANFTQLKISGNESSLNLIKDLFGEEFYNLLEDVFSKFRYNNDYIATSSIEEQQNALDYSNNAAGETLSSETEISEAKSPSFEHQTSTGIDSNNNEVLDSIMNKLGTQKGRRSLLLYTNTGNINHIPQEFRSLIEAIPKENIKDYLGIQNFDIGLQFFGKKNTSLTQLLRDTKSLDDIVKNVETVLQWHEMKHPGESIYALERYLIYGNVNSITNAGGSRDYIKSLSKEDLTKALNAIIKKRNCHRAFQIGNNLSPIQAIETYNNLIKYINSKFAYSYNDYMNYVNKCYQQDIDYFLNYEYLYLDMQLKQLRNQFQHKKVYNVLKSEQDIYNYFGTIGSNLYPVLIRAIKKISSASGHPISSYDLKQIGNIPYFEYIFATPSLDIKKYLSSISYKGSLITTNAKQNIINYLKQSHHGLWLSSLTVNEVLAIYEYTYGSGTILQWLTGSKIQSYFRIKSPEILNKIIEGLDSAIEKYGGLKDNMILYRGDDFNKLSLWKGWKVNNYNDLLNYIGKTVTCETYMSTGVSENGSFTGSVKWKIKAPIGTKGMYVNDFSEYFNNPNEFEFLVKRQSKFRIDNVYIKNGIVYIEAKIVN